VKNVRTGCDIEQGLTRAKARIAEAALEMLKARGFAGASARERARTGGFNHAFLLYHFGSVHNVLLAALGLVSNGRVRAYESAFENVRTVSEFARPARDIFTEDLEDGYDAAPGETVFGGASDPGLGLEVVARLESWIGMVERKPRARLIGLVSESMVPPCDLALAIIALNLGIDKPCHLDGSRTPARSLLDLGVRCAPVVEAPPSSPRTEKR
jgi:AcrR family transcriptional regulator